MKSRYAYRNELLIELGFASYAAYLESELWARIRSRVLARYRHKCQCCRDRATQVHHKHYSRAVLAGEHIVGLKAICAKCHRKIEFADGRKVEPPEANRAMRQIAIGNGLAKPLCSICRKNPTKPKQTICGRCKRDAG